jgi:hypothetical protein
MVVKAHRGQFPHLPYFPLSLLSPFWAQLHPSEKCSSSFRILLPSLSQIQPFLRAMAATFDRCVTGTCFPCGRWNNHLVKKEVAGDLPT